MRDNTDELEPWAIEALAEAVPDREPPARLRARILEAARADTLPRPRRTWALPAWWPRAAAVALAAAVVVLAVLNANTATQLASAEARLRESQAIAARVAQGGRTWDMQGAESWRSSGGTLFAPANAPAFVVFHDLPPLEQGSLYTIWLVDADGKWVRGSNFDRVAAVQMVDVGVPVVGSDRCAVTVETRTEGKRQGPIVMQSRLYERGAPQQQQVQ